MSKKVIALFSSDYRDLYKGDIFRVLCLPKNYIIEFRYRKEHLDQDILSKINGDELIDRDSIIFFVSGNDSNLTKEERLRNIEFHPIRKAEIKEIYYDENVEIVNFYLKLKDFTDKDYHPKTDEKDLPIYKMVSALTLKDVPEKSWINRVKDIEKEFNDSLFFHINSVRDGDKIKEPKYSSNNRSSYYQLQDGKNYQLDLSCYDPKSGSKLDVSYSSDDMKIHSSNGFIIDAIRKTMILDLKTNSLDVSSSSAITTLQENANNNNKHFSVNLNWRIKKSFWKPWVFGLLSALILIGLIIANASLPDTKPFLENMSWKLLVLGLIMVGSGSGLLFYLFNKK
ncbi:hypothetical protein LQ318_11695 [Aliifodinibius salicampi]|uniref:Gram-positive cocci surface proteins LPxTG domain-containing protein n=1 Tax=Fodinibius salicampi TaxID=1920655 RepID=A0ABT3Q0B9_9BACT|nr:hypothetical protein [Fodinibius salicampi]MCW9713564.1 hypothetical protein [Fodinibius salicampi]